jgi:hypothetical protein
MTTEAKTLTKADLSQFTGTETWYRHPLVRHVLYTEGVQYVAETGGAYWLVDEIAFTQLGEPHVAAEDFQVWRLTVNPDKTAALACEDGNGRTVYSKTPSSRRSGAPLNKNEPPVTAARKAVSSR